MLPGMNQRQMHHAMKQMGIKQEEVEATSVIIKTPTHDIVIDNPSIQKVKMMGQESYQISGEERIAEQEAKLEINEDDIKTVMEQASVDEEKARQALEENEGDIAAAIVSLQ
jgi:nascent polypeptide-associated complex subunit alpha